jgi:hypothetical protein
MLMNAHSTIKFELPGKGDPRVRVAFYPAVPPDAVN